ncbi:MAG TPA: hypothetical protein ENN22_03105 [bacterium]|nr:hypothetical protein [bacterium]
MISKIKLTLIQIREAVRQQGISGFFSKICEMIYLEQDVVVCVKDLSNFSSSAIDGTKFDVMFVGIDREIYHKLKPVFSSKSRQLKIQQYLKNGYIGFAALRDSQVIGDVWGIINHGNGAEVKHKDFQWFGFQITDHEAYMFDMFIVDNERGSGLVNDILKFALGSLRQKGCRRVFGSFRTKNLPALWMHRVLGYQELFRVRTCRLFTFRWSKKLNS